MPIVSLLSSARCFIQKKVTEKRFFFVQRREEMGKKFAYANECKIRKRFESLKSMTIKRREKKGNLAKKRSFGLKFYARDAN